MPSRIIRSGKATPAASTLTRTSPSFGSGHSSSITRSASGPMIESKSIQQHFEPHHQLLGHPKEIQGEMQTECQFASNGYYCGGASRFQNPPLELLNGTKDWRLLFQLDTDDDIQSGKPGIMWGDCGRLYFWIRHQDLAMGRFEDTWMVLQCS